MNFIDIRNGNMNKVYLLEVDNDNKYIIRTSLFDNNFECKVLYLLKKTNFKCPNIITNFEIEDKKIIIYRYIDGDNPKKFDNDFYIRLAQLLKKLHQIDNDFKDNEYAQNEENKFKLAEYYNKAINSKYLSDSLDLINENYKYAMDVNLNELDKCIIHSDIKRENMIENGRDLYLIDFGNCYVGNRLIDIIRVIMWFFIKDDNYDMEKIKLFIDSYFDDKKLTNKEIDNIDKMIIYCILYNLLKDISLNEDNILSSEYIESNSLNWVRALKNKEKVLKIGELIKNA